MPDVYAILLFSGALFLAAATPGPSITAMVSRVIIKGWRDVLPFIAAMWIGEALWMTVAIAGLAAIADSITWALVGIKYIGITYLIYLAWGMWRAPVDVPDDELKAGSGSIAMFMTGMALTLGNPKIILFYLALLPTLIDVPSITVAGWAVLFAVTVGILAVIDLSYMLLAARARNYLSSPRMVRITNKVCATALGGAAVAIASK